MKSHRCHITYLQDKTFSWKWLKITLLWNVSPCTLIEINGRFREAYCLHLQDRTVIYSETHFTEMSVHLSQYTASHSKNVSLFGWSAFNFMKPNYVLLGCGATSLGDWCPTFRDSMQVSSSNVEMITLRKESPSYTTPHRRRTDISPASLRKPTSYVRDCCFVRGVFYMLTLRHFQTIAILRQVEIWNAYKPTRYDQTTRSVWGRFHTLTNHQW